MGSKAIQQRAVRLDVELSCRGCARAVPIHGLYLRSSCGGCGTAVELSAPGWLALLKEVDERSFSREDPSSSSERAEQSIPSGRLIASWSPVGVKCAGCQRELALVEPGTTDTIECAACGAKLETFPAPPWLRTELPTAMQLYGIPRASDDSAVHAARGFWLTFKGTPPAFIEQHRQVIEAAIGPGPVSSSVVSKPVPKRRLGWEWYAIGICTALIVFAVHQCGSRLGKTTKPDEGTEVEPSL